MKDALHMLFNWLVLWVIAFGLGYIITAIWIVLKNTFTRSR